MKLNKRLFAAAVFTGILAVAAAFTIYGKERLPAPDDTFWDNEKATWSEVENASKYEVKLYRDGSAVSSATYQTKKTTYSFKSKMTEEGYYTFRVRALPKNRNYSESSWSEYSDEVLITEEEAAKFTSQKAESQSNVNTGGSGPGDSSKMSTWKSNDIGWWYENKDGSYQQSSWLQINGVWYYFNETGYMVTGWLNLGEQTYYCDPASGAMQTGTITIDGQTYTFDENGVMIK